MYYLCNYRYDHINKVKKKVFFWLANILFITALFVTYNSVILAKKSRYQKFFGVLLATSVGHDLYFNNDKIFLRN